MEAWIGVVGAIAGALVGGVIAAYMSYREQQREPKLLILEKRIESHSELYGRLYEIATCIRQNLPPQDMMKRIHEFRSAVLGHLLYVDPQTREKVLAVYNHLMNSVDTGKIEVDRLMVVLNEATRALVDGIEIKYT